MAAQLTLDGKPYVPVTPGDMRNIVHEDRDMGVLYGGLMRDALDISDLSHINQALLSARRAVGIITNQLTEANARLDYAKAALSRKESNILLRVSGGTAADRDAVVKGETLEEAEDVRVWSTVVNKLKDTMTMVRKDLDILTVLSNNMRAEMRMVS